MYKRQALLLLKRDRRAQVVAVLAILMVAYLVIDPQSGAKKKRPQQASTARNAQMATLSEHSGDLVTRFTEDLQKTRLQADETAKKLSDIDRKMEENTARTAEIFKKILERVADSESNKIANGVTNVSTRGVPGEAPLPGEYGTESLTEADELQPFGLENPVMVPPPAPPPGRKVIIAPGDSVRVKLLAGVNAPTDGSPYPIVVKTISDVFGPDGSALPLGESRIVAAAQGSLADQRVLFRVTKLNLRLPDGRRKIVDVDGWVVGEDGIRGMAGFLIDPIGKAIAGVGMAGFLQGVGDGMSASQLETTTYGNGNQNTMIAGNTAEYAAGRGLSGAANEYASLIRQRVDQLVPHIQVLSGREATVVFARETVIPDLYEALESEDSTGSSLD